MLCWFLKLQNSFLSPTNLFQSNNNRKLLHCRLTVKVGFLESLPASIIHHQPFASKGVQIFGEHGQRQKSMHGISTGTAMSADVSTRTLDLLDELGIQTNHATYISLLRHCANTKALSEGKRVHAYIMAIGEERSSVLGNLLVQMYSKCGALEDAQAVFMNMHQRNVVSWTIIIRAYAQHGQEREALRLFEQMRLDGVMPDKVTYISVLDACARLAALAEGKQVHALIIGSGFGSDMVVGTCLINMYGKCGSVDDARKIFNKMPERDVVSWSAMIAAYAHNQHGKQALQLFQRMQQVGVTPNRATFISILDACGSLEDLTEVRRVHDCIIGNQWEIDVVVETALLHMYSKCGSLTDAQRVFDKMPERSVVSWNAMIAAYAQHRHGNHAVRVLEQMELEGVIPNKVTFISIVDACASLADLTTGRQMHARIVSSGFEMDVVVATALVHMYSKCGSLEEARRMFDKMPEQNVISWNAMITAYAQHSQPKEVFTLFQQMQQKGMMPDRVTFISILDACANQESVAEGKLLHARIVCSGFESDVVVGTALINMYSKCGSLKDACRMFVTMPERNVVSWSAMIAAYARHGQGKQAIQTFEQMQVEGVVPHMITLVSILDACAGQTALTFGKQMHAIIMNSGFELNVVVATALVNMYAKCGSLEDARRMFEKMPEQDVVSWTVMIAAYAEHGQGREALQVFEQMQLGGIIPSNSTFVSILSACSHIGLVDEGCCYFISMTKDYGITPTVKHYTCMIDLLGRVGWLIQVEDLINNMISEPVTTSWMALLSACRIHSDVERGKRATESIVNSRPASAAPYVILSNMYATVGRWEDATAVRKTMEEHGLKLTLKA